MTRLMGGWGGEGTTGATGAVSMPQVLANVHGTVRVFVSEVTRTLPMKGSDLKQRQSFKRPPPSSKRGRGLPAGGDTHGDVPGAFTVGFVGGREPFTGHDAGVCDQVASAFKGGPETRITSFRTSRGRV